MDKIIINIHSLVDLITNSSTELFVLDTDKSLKVIKEILQDCIVLHNKASKTNYSFTDIFNEPYIGSGTVALSEWSDYYKSKIDKGIIIKGAGGNSIPYWMFDFIESVFGYRTEKFHLG